MDHRYIIETTWPAVSRSAAVALPYFCSGFGINATTLPPSGSILGSIGQMPVHENIRTLPTNRRGTVDPNKHTRANTFG
jgi:hypothetical protein